MLFSNIREFSWLRRRSATSFFRTSVASAAVAFMLEFTLNVSVEVPNTLFSSVLVTFTDASLVYWMCLSDLAMAVRVTWSSVSVKM